MAQTSKQVNTAIIAHLDPRNMKPSQIIKKQCKTQKDYIKVLEMALNRFLGDSEALWALNEYKVKKE
jgi:hypothetical protein